MIRFYSALVFFFFSFLPSVFASDIGYSEPIDVGTQYVSWRGNVYPLLSYSSFQCFAGAGGYIPFVDNSYVLHINND